MEKHLIKDWLKERNFNTKDFKVWTITESELHDLCLKVAEQQRKIDRDVLIEHNQLKSADIIYFNSKSLEL